MLAELETDFFPWRIEVERLKSTLPFNRTRSPFKKALTERFPAQHLCFIGEQLLHGDEIIAQDKELAKLFLQQASLFGSPRASLLLLIHYTNDEALSTACQHQGWIDWLRTGLWLGPEMPNYVGDYGQLGQLFQEGVRLKQDMVKACLCFLKSHDIDCLLPAAIELAEVRQVLSAWRKECLLREKKPGNLLTGYMRLLRNTQESAVTKDATEFAEKELNAIKTQLIAAYHSVDEGKSRTLEHKLGWLNSEEDLHSIEDILRLEKPL